MDETVEAVRPQNSVDREFFALEKEFHPEERGALARTLIEELNSFDSQLGKEAHKKGDIRAELADGKNGIKRFILPGIPGKGEDMFTLREGYQGWPHHDYHKSEHHVFAKADQGYMWEVPLNRNPYLHFTMSECSAIVAKTEDALVAAHISYSNAGEVRAVLEYLKEKGAKPEDIHVVASVGEEQKQRAERELANFMKGDKKTEKQIEDYKRFTKPEDYEALGVTKENIQTFEYKTLLRREGNRETDKVVDGNLVNIIASKDMLYTGVMERKFVPGARKEETDYVSESSIAI